MRKIHDILRLQAAGLSARQIALSVSLARSTVAECLRRARLAGLAWPLPEALDEAAVERRLYPPVVEAELRPAVDWAHVHRELRRRGVTLTLLWEEYQTQHPDGYQYSRFCELYRAWQGRVDVVMRQEHRAGERLFVDYAGQTVPVLDRHTGELRPTQIFVAVMGASSYTYAEATWSQSLPDWLGAHSRVLAFLGGVPQIVVPDNLRSAVSRAHAYEPELNPAYQQWADHYGVAVVPARVRKPRDKAKAEAGVLLVERWILARLRNQTFHSLDALNAEIRQLLERLNQRPFRRLPGSRASVFAEVDRPALRPLPANAYEYADWQRVRIGLDYHVSFDRHYYSVPHTLARQSVDLRATATTVEVLHRGQRIASHRRSPMPYGYTTVAEHMPSHHRHQAEWTPDRLLRWAESIGPQTRAAVQQILVGRRHPEQGFRSAMGVLRLGREVGQERLEAACARAVALGACRYRSLKAILDAGLERLPITTHDSPELPDHDNVRGPQYYH